MCLCLCSTGLVAPGRSGGQSVTTWLARMQHEVREVVAFCRQVVVLEETVGNRVEKQLPLYCASPKKKNRHVSPTSGDQSVWSSVKQSINSINSHKKYHYNSQLKNKIPCLVKCVNIRNIAKVKSYI